MYIVILDIAFKKAFISNIIVGDGYVVLIFIEICNI